MTPTDVVFVAGIASALIVALILAAWLRRRAPAPAPALRVQVFVNGCLLIDADAATLANLVAFKGGKPDMHRFRGDVVVGFRVDP